MAIATLRKNFNINVHKKFYLCIDGSLVTRAYYSNTGPKAGEFILDRLPVHHTSPCTDKHLFIVETIKYNQWPYIVTHET